MLIHVARQTVDYNVQLTGYKSVIRYTLCFYIKVVLRDTIRQSFLTVYCWYFYANNRGLARRSHVLPTCSITGTDPPVALEALTQSPAVVPAFLDDVNLLKTSLTHVTANDAPAIGCRKHNVTTRAVSLSSHGSDASGSGSDESGSGSDESGSGSAHYP